VKTAKFFSSLL